MTDYTIDIDKFPAQGDWLVKKVRVCFNHDTSRTITGIVVRDDTEEHGRMIIKLEDERYILSTECQFKHIDAHR